MGGLQIKKVTAQEGVNTRTVLCVLKSNSKGTWSILENEYHLNQGCKTISQDSRGITITYTRFEKIAGNNFEEDNVLLSRNIGAGGSVGLDRSIIQFYKNGRRLKPREVIGSTANVFVSVNGVDNVEEE